MIDSTHIFVTNSELMFIPIGKVIQHVFQDRKPAHFDDFLKLYEFMISNIFWIIEPAKDRKKKQCWEICVECNMCGALLHEKIVIFKKFKFAGDYMQNFTKHMLTESIKITNDVKNLMNHLSLNCWICAIESGNILATKNNLNL